MLGSEYQFADVMIHPFLMRLPLLAHFRGYQVPSASKFPLVSRLNDACNAVCSSSFPRFFCLSIYIYIQTWPSLWPVELMYH